MPQSNAQGDPTADAVDCFLCLTDPDADPRQRARWAAWLGENAGNRAAYQAVKETWSQPVPSDLWPSHQEIVDDAYDPDQPVVTPSRSGTGTRKPKSDERASSRKGTPLAWVAAGLAVAVVAVAGWRTFQPTERSVSSRVAYRTERGGDPPDQAAGRIGGHAWTSHDLQRNRRSGEQSCASSERRRVAVDHA